jgi:tRNA uridine 5-carboxymethylaminomethyl modification enzyme
MGGAQIEKKGSQKKTAEEVLTMPDVTLKDVEDIIVAVQQEARTAGPRDYEEDEFTRSPSSVYDTVEASIKYQHYAIRQHRDMQSWRRAQGVRIPPDVIYSRQFLPSLAQEELEKLSQARPSTFAQASQISGITPQSLIALYNFVMRRSKEREQAPQSYETPKQTRKKFIAAQTAVAEEF